VALPPQISTILRLFRDVEGTDSQVESGVKCYRKPNRTTERTFTAQDAARIMCYAFKEGATESEMVQRFRIHCRGEARGRPNAAAEAIAVAMQQLSSNNELLLDEWRAFLVVNGILLGLIALLGIIRLAGPLRLVASPLRLAARVSQTQVANLITRNIMQRSANDAVFNQLREVLRQAA